MPNEADWPIVVTNRCADACVDALGLSGREPAREWLYELVADRGSLVRSLPKPMSGRRSPSGWFALVDGMLVLPLAADRGGAHQWIATNCLVFPGYRQGGDVDPFTLRGKALLDQVTVLEHAVQRFQQRCGGSPGAPRAERELRERLAPTVRAQRQPPAWCGTRPSDFYLVAGEKDEYCLPCRTGGGARPFDVITCIHQASDLFELKSTKLLSRSAIDSQQLPPGSYHRRLLDESFRTGGRLSWHRPRWVRHGSATWWIVFERRMAAPVSWHPEDRRHPLRVLGFADRRPWPVRLVHRLFHNG